MTTIIMFTYQELHEFRSDDPDSQVVARLGQAFGQSGLGILAVSCVPEFETVRQKLLRAANQLPNIENLDQLVDEASLYSIGWSHGKEQIAGQPDYSKGSFYANPFDSNESNNRWPNELPELKSSLLEMSQILYATGCRIAAVCDAYCQSQGVVTTRLLETLQANQNSKARLLHYFANPTSSSWCAWHNDHGSLTGLVPGLYRDTNGAILECPDPQSCGLYICNRSNEQVKANIPQGCCGFQVGETFQILSGNVLQATPHAVLSGGCATNVTRQSFALFLQPTLDTVLNLPQECSDDNNHWDDTTSTTNNSNNLPLLPISKRWKPGQTFGDFHWATIRSYAVNKKE